MLHPGRIRDQLATTFALLSLLALPACFMGRYSQNEPLHMTDVEHLQPGKTTAEQVVDLLGAPADVVQLGKRSAYLYRHVQDKNAGLWLLLVGFYNNDTREDRIWVFFDENNVLTHLGSTFASHHTEYGMPWYDLHDDASNAAADKARLAEERGAHDK